MRQIRPFALAALLVGASLLPATPAAAQVRPSSMGWRVCFTSAIGSCSEFFLTTTPIWSQSTGRTGTIIDAMFRHESVGPRATGLQSFTFYAGVAGGVEDGAPIVFTPQSINGAPLLDGDQVNRWSVRSSIDESNPENIFGNWLSFTSGFNPDDRQFIGGCAGNDFGDDVTTAATTCGNQAYGFSFTSTAWFDADDMARLAVDIYAGDGNGDFFPDIAACNAPLDGTPGEGFDVGEADFTAVCSATEISASVPEPPTWWLLLAAGAALAPLVVRRRRERLLMAAAAATLSLSACSGADTPVSPAAEVAPMVVSSDLRAAVSDANDRVVPALSVARQPALHEALTELEQALHTGARVRAERAVNRLDLLLQGDPTDVSDVADLSALRVLVAATRESLAAAQ